MDDDDGLLQFTLDANNDDESIVRVCVVVVVVRRLITPRLRTTEINTMLLILIAVEDNSATAPTATTI